jgi:uncharacterized membrane protein YsdA (DUF1294 family)
MNFISENHWILYYLLVINIITFIIYGLDKLLAIKEKSRIRVSSLLLLAFLGGEIGGYLAMKIFHHKTQKKWFTIGLPLIFLMHVAVIYLVFIH